MAGALSQAIEALRYGHEIRMARAQLKREIKNGEALASKVLVDELPSWLERMPVHELLIAIPHIGQFNAGRLLKRAGINPTRMLGSVTPRQRRVLADALEERGNSG